jgi:hypothetical protein
MKHSDLFIYNKDVPKWDYKKLHFYDQSLEVIDFYTEEFEKCINGVTIGGVWFHPWLYFHLNFFKTPIPLKNGTEPITEPFLRDNEWYVADMFKRGQDEGKNIFMFGTRRFAKALRDDQLLFLINGTTKKIGEAVVGDIIFGSDGLPTTITEVAPQGIKELYEVHLEDGRVSICCEDHLWTTYNKHGNKNVYDLGTIIKKMTKSNPFYISNAKALQYGDVRLSTPPYELGNRIGNRQSVDFEEVMLIASVEQKDEFVRGLIESDVKFLKRCEKYIKLQLHEYTHIDNLTKVFRSLGYEVRVIEENDAITFMFTNKRSSLVRIKDIVKIDSDYATCIMVDNESKEFVTNDYIVTHNSVMETSMIHWSAITKPNTTSEIICGATVDLNQITRFLRLSTTNINPAFRMPTTKNDYGKHVQFGYRESGTGSVIAYSDVFIKNADSGKEAASEKGAGGAPVLVILDEALEENTPLITGSGKVPIKDINIGDEIYDDSGKLTTVEDKIKFENRQLYKIEFSDGRSIEACENHLWEIYEGDLPSVEKTKYIIDNIGVKKLSIRIESPEKSKLVEIVNIESSKIGTAYCIKVDNDSKLFLAGDYIVTHNCGKYSFLKMYLGLLPALQTPHGQKGTIFLSGTSGNEKLSKDAFKVLSNPEAYNVLPMDWSVLNDKVPKIYQTWSESKFGVFVPGQMSYEKGLIKKESNLSEYLGIDNRELKKIKIQETDWKTSTEILKAKRVALEKDRESYNKQVMYFPLDPNDCFLSGMSTPFPVHTARMHMNQLVERGEIGKNVEIFKKDGNVLGYELSSLPRAKFPFEGGIHDAPVILYEEPPEILPEKHEFVSGLDPYKAKEANTSSVGSFYTIKRKLDLKQPIEIIVASYASRPSTQKKFNRTCEYLIEGWNSECLMENADQSIIQYLEDKNKMYLLAEGIEWSRMINPNTKARTTTGYAPTPKNQAYVFSLVVDYCNTEIDTGVLDVNGEPIIKLGVEYIPDVELLQEIIDWKDGMNADRIVSFGSALAWARYLDKLRVIPRVRTDLDEKTKRDAERRKAEAKARAFSKVTTVLRK